MLDWAPGDRKPEQRKGLLSLHPVEEAPIHRHAQHWAGSYLQHHRRGDPVVPEYPALPVSEEKQIIFFTINQPDSNNFTSKILDKYGSVLESRSSFAHNKYFRIV